MGMALKRCLHFDGQIGGIVSERAYSVTEEV